MPRTIRRQPRRLSSISLALAVGSAAAGYTVQARAHIRLAQPPSRYADNPLKSPPCGHPDNPPGEVEPTVVQGGQPLTVEVDETIAHRGHLRIALAASDAEFVTPTGFDDFYNADNVIIDDYEDPQGAQYFAIDVAIPDIDCASCVLQVIQVMYDDDGFQPNDLYFECADLVVQPSQAGTTSAGSSSGSAGGAGTTATSDTPSTSGPEAGTSGDKHGTSISTAAGDDGDETMSDTTGSEAPEAMSTEANAGCGCSVERRSASSWCAYALALLLGGPRRRRLLR